MPEAFYDPRQDTSKMPAGQFYDPRKGDVIAQRTAGYIAAAKAQQARSQPNALQQVGNAALDNPVTGAIYDVGTSALSPLKALVHAGSLAMDPSAEGRYGKRGLANLEQHLANTVQRGVIGDGGTQTPYNVTNQQMSSREPQQMIEGGLGTAMIAPGFVHGGMANPLMARRVSQAPMPAPTLRPLGQTGIGAAADRTVASPEAAKPTINIPRQNRTLGQAPPRAAPEMNIGGVAPAQGVPIAVPKQAAREVPLQPAPGNSGAVAEGSAREVVPTPAEGQPAEAEAAKEVTPALQSAADAIKIKRSKQQQGAVVLPGGVSSAVHGAHGYMADIAQGERYGPQYQISTKAGDAANQMAGTRAAAEAFVHSVIARGGLNTADQATLQAALLSERANAFTKRTGMAVPGIPHMTDAEIDKVLQDPKFAKAIDLHKNEINPYVLAQRKLLSPQLKEFHTRSGIFQSAYPTKDAEGDAIEEGQVGGGPANQQRIHGVREAEHFTGGATEYGLSYADTLKRMVAGPANDLAKFNYIKAITQDVDKGGNRLGVRIPNTKGAEIPKTIEYNGVKYGVGQPVGIQVREVNLGTRLGKPATMRVAMPAPIAKAFDDVTLGKGVGMSGIPEPWKNLQSFLAGSRLALNPAALSAHAGRVLRTIAAIPAVHQGWAGQVADAIVPLGGVTRRAKDLFDMDMNNPDNARRMIDVVKNNAGGLRGLGEAAQGTKLHIPILSDIQKATHGALFGLPEGKASLLRPAQIGLDMRARVWLGKLHEAWTNETGTRAERAFQNQIGQYGSKINPAVEFARDALNPYGGTTFPLQMTEARQMVFGGSGMKAPNTGAAIRLRAQTLANRWIPVMTGFTIANKVLSGRYPWQNPPEHRFDLAVGEDSDGKTIYIGAGAWLPELERIVQTTGIKSDVGQTGRRSEGAGTALARGITNRALSDFTPAPVDVAQVAASGTTPYITRFATRGRPDLGMLQVAPTARRGSQQPLLNTATAAGEVNPMLGGLGSLVTSGIQKKQSRYQRSQKLYGVGAKALNGLTSLVTGRPVSK